MVCTILLWSTNASLTVIRLCTETPTAGGRIFETGDEMLLQFAHENKGAFSISVLSQFYSIDWCHFQSVPLVLVFTQHDRLVRTKTLQLQSTITDPNLLRQRSEQEAQDTFKGTLNSLRDTMGDLGIPMPKYATVSGIFPAISLLGIDHLFVRVITTFHNLWKSLGRLLMNESRVTLGVMVDGTTSKSPRQNWSMCL